MSRVLDRAIYDGRNQIMAYGWMASAYGAVQTGTLQPFIAALDPTGIVSGTRITIREAGVYYIEVRQLSRSNNPVYHHLRKNGALLNYGYTTTNEIDDLITKACVPCVPGDYFEVQPNVPASPATVEQWSTPHSSFSIFRIDPRG